MGGIVQVIFYIINEIKERIFWVVQNMNFDVVIIEIGGIVGDIEFLFFLEVIC